MFISHLVMLLSGHCITTVNLSRVCALVLSDNFLKYMEAFRPFFAAGLKNIEEYQV